jgi:hypothetical protein
MQGGARSQVVRQLHLAQALGVAAGRGRFESQRQLSRRRRRGRERHERCAGAATRLEVQERHGLAELTVQHLLALVRRERLELRIEHALSFCRQQVEDRRRTLDAAQERQQSLLGWLRRGRRRCGFRHSGRLWERGATGAGAGQYREHASPNQAPQCSCAGSHQNLKRPKK